jgi:hypothetical protein
MNDMTTEQTSTPFPIDLGHRCEAVSNLNSPASAVPTNMKTTSRLSRRAAVLAALLIPCLYVQAQTAPAPAAVTPEDDLVVLSPFEVRSSGSEGYNASSTLAGNRLNTQLRDVGSAVTVITSQFLRDTAATNNSSLLQYAPSSEVGGIYGNFAGAGDGAQLNEPTQRPNENTRIRGLAAADNTRDFFRTEIPWDSYNIDRVDLQRGPNSILFGQGSPAGIINAGTKVANFHNSGEVEGRYGSYGSARVSLDLNQVLVKDQVAIRLEALNDHEKFKQKPAYSKDQRLAGSIRVEPEFLKKNGNRTIIKANFESGQIDANNPRELPPQDNITPWFTSQGQQQLIGWNAFDHISGRPGNGAARSVDDLNGVIPGSGIYSSPWFHGSSFGTQSGQEPTAFYAGNGAAPTYMITSVPAGLQAHGLGGATGGTIGGLGVAPGFWNSTGSTSNWAVNSNQPFAKGGVYKNNLLTNPSIFNFYNKLIDGDTKREWQRFNSESVNLTQTFLDDQVGFSLDYNKEHYESGEVALLGGNVALTIDPMKVFNNGTPDVGATPGVSPFSDGTPNPNLGRPFVSSTGGVNNSFTSERESKRATGFATHDFAKTDQSWIGRILGTQTLTALAAEDSQKVDSRNWQRYGYLDPSIYSIEQTSYATNAFNSSNVVPTQIVYLGGSLLGKSIIGANIPSVSGNPTVGNGQLTYFNDQWKRPTDPTAAGYVDPKAPWNNNVFLPGKTGYAANQGDNPANYVGWTTAPLNVTDAEASLANRNLLTTQAALTKSLTTSQALVWQGKMLDGAIVGTYGWRKDINKSWATTEQVSGNANLPDGSRNPNYKQIDFNNYRLPTTADARVEVQSRAYSIVAHMMDLPGLKSATKNLPFDISFSYNVSTNFKPDASRVDVQGNPIASPSGKTIDRGIQIETRDGRYSLKLSRYVTTDLNATGSNSYGFGNNLATILSYDAFWANVWDYHIGNGFFDNKTPGFFESGPNERWQFANSDNSLTAQTAADQTSSVAGMRAMEADLDKALPGMWKAFGFTSLAYVQSGSPIPNALNSPAVVPNGFAVTEDSVSKGWELELNAQPTKNWRLTLNASKSEAVRTNIGGTALNTLMNIMIKDLQGPAGQMHYWWGTADVPRAGAAFYQNFPLGVDWAGRKLLEGNNVPELREWRVNLISNSDITSGILKGVNYGGGVRYQSDVTIGYPPTGDSLVPATYGYDLARPYKGPSETNFDLWLGYRHRVTAKIDWHIQLNVRNAFKGNDLIPITVQGPATGQTLGTPAGYRIAPSQTFTLTNTFSF